MPDPLPAVLPAGTRVVQGNRDVSGWRREVIYRSPTGREYCLATQVDRSSLPNPTPATTPDVCTCANGVRADDCRVHAESFGYVDPVEAASKGGEPSEYLTKEEDGRLQELVRHVTRKDVILVRDWHLAFDAFALGKDAGRASLAKRNALLEAFVEWVEKSQLDDGFSEETTTLDRLAQLARDLAKAD